MQPVKQPEHYETSSGLVRLSGSEAPDRDSQASLLLGEEGREGGGATVCCVPLYTRGARFALLRGSGSNSLNPDD